MGEKGLPTGEAGIRSSKLCSSSDSSDVWLWGSPRLGPTTDNPVSACWCRQQALLAWLRH